MGNFFRSGGGGAAVSSYSTQSVGSGGTINSLNQGTQYRPVAGSGGAQTASTTPFGTGGLWATGTKIILRGTDGTNTLTIQHNDAQYGAILNGNMTLGLNDILELIYDATSERWVETGRNN